MANRVIFRNKVRRDNQCKNIMRYNYLKKTYDSSIIHGYVSALQYRFLNKANISKEKL